MDGGTLLPASLVMVNCSQEMKKYRVAVAARWAGDAAFWRLGFRCHFGLANIFMLNKNSVILIASSLADSECGSCFGVSGPTWF